LRVADRAQDRIHATVQRTQFFEAHLVDFVRRHVGSGASAQRPGIIFFATRQLPDAGVAGRARLQRFQHGDLAIERRRDVLLGDAGCIGREARAEVGARGARGERRNDAPLRVRGGATGAELLQRLRQQEIRQHHAARRIGAHAHGFAVELARVSVHAREIGIGVGGGDDRMAGAEEGGDFDERADVLRHHVGRVAVRPVVVEDGDVAVRKLEAVCRKLVDALHDIDIELLLGTQSLRVQPPQLRQRRTHMAFDRALARSRVA
jgi:hypothetical protein